MFSFLRGDVVEIDFDHIVLERDGMGFKIFLGQRDLGILDLGQQKIYTEMIVREDEISLCGFLDPLDRTIFQRLQRVSGIGVKTALGLLGIFTGAEIVSFVLDENLALLTKAPGIGKKTASRLILELKDYFLKDFSHIEAPEETGHSQNKQELREALLSLGYGGGEIQRVTANLDFTKPLEVLLRESLAQLVK